MLSQSKKSETRFTAKLAAVAVAALVAGPASAQFFSEGNGLVTESAYALHQNNWGRAVKLAKDAIRSGDLTAASYAAAYNNLCVGFTGLKDFEAAGTACDKAVKLGSSQWSFYNNRGNLHFHMAKYELALADYTKAAELNPGDAVVMQNIQLATAKLKGTSPALSSLDSGIVQTAAAQ